MKIAGVILLCVAVMLAVVAASMLEWIEKTQFEKLAVEELSRGVDNKTVLSQETFETKNGKLELHGCYELKTGNRVLSSDGRRFVDEIVKRYFSCAYREGTSQLFCFKSSISRMRDKICEL